MGISPQYRGSSTNFWAMYHGRYECVGATIHRLTKGLDSGPIYCHSYPDKAYEAFEFGMRSVEQAHKDLVEQLYTLKGMIPYPQDKSLELSYTRNAHFTDEVAQEYLGRLPTVEQIQLRLDEKRLEFSKS